MKSILSTLSEQIILLKNSSYTQKTTVSRFDEIVNVRAKIKPISTKKFEVIALKPPLNFKDIPIAAIRWQGVDYILITYFSEYKGKFLKGIVETIGTQRSELQQG